MRRMDYVLSDEDIIRITRILADDNTEGAWAFSARRLSQSNGERPAKRCDIVIEAKAADDLSSLIEAGDKASCLSFLREHFEKEIKLMLTPHCVPVFESSYKPNQADKYATFADGVQGGISP